MNDSNRCPDCDAELSPEDEGYGHVVCIRSLADRIAKLEAQLGAATSGVVPVSAADCSGSHTTPKQGSQQAGESGSGPAAAPSVSAERWIKLGDDAQALGRSLAARACDLAAAVTEVYEQTQHLSIDYDTERMRQFTRLVLAFVRSEKLPEVGT